MSDNIILVPSRELVLKEIDKIKQGSESEILNLAVTYSSIKPAKCISISQNLSKELIKHLKPIKISTIFSLEREFANDEIKSDCAESQKKLASELDLDNENVFYISDDEDDLKLVATNYEIQVLTVEKAIKKIKDIVN